MSPSNTDSFKFFLSTLWKKEPSRFCSALATTFSRRRASFTASAAASCGPPQRGPPQGRGAEKLDAAAGRERPTRCEGPTARPSSALCAPTHDLRRGRPATRADATSICSAEPGPPRRISMLTAALSAPSCAALREFPAISPVQRSGALPREEQGLEGVHRARAHRRARRALRLAARGRQRRGARAAGGGARRLLRRHLRRRLADPRGGVGGPQDAARRAEAALLQGRPGVRPEAAALAAAGPLRAAVGRQDGLHRDVRRRRGGGVRRALAV